MLAPSRAARGAACLLLSRSQPSASSGIRRGTRSAAHGTTGGVARDGRSSMGSVHTTPPSSSMRTAQHLLLLRHASQSPLLPPPTLPQMLTPPQMHLPPRTSPPPSPPPQLRNRRCRRHRRARREWPPQPSLPTSMPPPQLTPPPPQPQPPASANGPIGSRIAASPSPHFATAPTPRSWAQATETAPCKCPQPPRLPDLFDASGPEKVCPPE